MPRIQLTFPMATGTDELRFRLVWAALTHDPCVTEARALERDNPFIQRVTFEVFEGARLSPLVAGQIVPYLERSGANLGNVRGLQPTEEAILESPSAKADSSWMALVPNWIRPGCWIRSGDIRFMVLRVDVAANVVLLQAEDKTEPESFLLDALRLFLTTAPPSRWGLGLTPIPSLWDRLLRDGLDD